MMRWGCRFLYKFVELIFLCHFLEGRKKEREACRGIVKNKKQKDKNLPFGNAMSSNISCFARLMAEQVSAVY